MTTLGRYIAIIDFVNNLTRDGIVTNIIQIARQDRANDDALRESMNSLGRYCQYSSTAQLKQVLGLYLYLIEVKKLENINALSWLVIILKYARNDREYKKLTPPEQDALYNDPVCSWLLSTNIANLSFHPSSNTALTQAFPHRQQHTHFASLGRNSIRDISQENFAIAEEVLNSTVAIVKITHSDQTNHTYMLHLDAHRIHGSDWLTYFNSPKFYLHQALTCSNQSLRDEDWIGEEEKHRYYRVIKSLTPQDRVDVKIFSGSVSYDSKDEVEGFKSLLIPNHCSIDILRINTGANCYYLRYDLLDDNILIQRTIPDSNYPFISISNLFGRGGNQKYIFPPSQNRFINDYQNELITACRQPFQEEWIPNRLWVLQETKKNMLEKYITAQEEWLQRNRNSVFGSLINLLFNPETTKQNIAIVKQILAGNNNAISQLSGEEQLKEFLHFANELEKEYHELSRSLSEKYIPVVVEHLTDEDSDEERYRVR